MMSLGDRYVDVLAEGYDVDDSAEGLGDYYLGDLEADYDELAFDDSGDLGELLAEALFDGQSSATATEFDDALADVLETMSTAEEINFTRALGALPAAARIGGTLIGGPVVGGVLGGVATRVLAGGPAAVASPSPSAPQSSSVAGSSTAAQPSSAAAKALVLLGQDDQNVQKSLTKLALGQPGPVAGRPVAAGRRIAARVRQRHQRRVLHRSRVCRAPRGGSLPRACGRGERLPERGRRRAMIAGVGSDPLALAGRVFEQVVGRLAPDEVLDGAGETPADELLATALGNRLAQMISGGDDPLQADGSDTDGDGGWMVHYQELLDRDSALAAALGACDCWGEDRGCPTCDGAGAPGWALPDQRLYAAYVQPAVDAAVPRVPRPARTQSVTDKQPQEQDDVQLA